MEKIGRYAAIVGFAFVAAYFGAAIGTHVELNWEGSASIGAIELVTIVLAALGVMLAVLTIFLAVLGFIGFSTINDRLKEHSKNFFNEELQNGRPAFELLKQAVRNAMYEGIDPIVPNQDRYGDDDDNQTLG